MVFLSYQSDGRLITVRVITAHTFRPAQRFPVELHHIHGGDDESYHNNIISYARPIIDCTVIMMRVLLYALPTNYTPQLLY